MVVVALVVVVVACVVVVVACVVVVVACVVVVVACVVVVVGRGRGGLVVVVGRGGLVVVVGRGAAVVEVVAPVSVVTTRVAVGSPPALAVVAFEVVVVPFEVVPFEVVVVPFLVEPWDDLPPDRGRTMISPTGPFPPPLPDAASAGPAVEEELVPGAWLDEELPSRDV